MHVTTGKAFDAKRNTSQQFAPDPRAVEAALEACRRLRSSDPALVRWIEDGHPTLTEAEHGDRFGEPYSRKLRRAADA